MKVFSLTVLYKGSKVSQLKGAYELSSFGYFQRSSIQEFMRFTAQIVVERTQSGVRATVKEQEYNCHVYVRNDSLAGVVVTDHEYPPRVAFTLINKFLDQFATEVACSTWPTVSESDISFTLLDQLIQDYQTPDKADAMMRLQSDLDETKIIMHSCIDSMLQRGEKLDDLVAKSDALSTQSKTFYKTARKANSCCVIL